jgi:hypothetical protein
MRSVLLVVALLRACGAGPASTTTTGSATTLIPGTLRACNGPGARREPCTIPTRS